MINVIVSTVLSCIVADAIIVIHWLMVITIDIYAKIIRIVIIIQSLLLSVDWFPSMEKIINIMISIIICYVNIWSLSR